MSSARLRQMIDEIYNVAPYTPDAVASVMMSHVSGVIDENKARMETIRLENDVLNCAMVKALTTLSFNARAGRYKYKELTDNLESGISISFLRGIEKGRAMDI